MSLATWDKIVGALGSTTDAFGGSWGNLISDYMNGVDIGITDPTKRPRPNTLTRFKFEKLGMFDGDESHHVLFSVDDIDTGSTRKIHIRRMNSPNEEDYMVMENLTQTITAKSIDSDLNTFSNIKNSDIKVGAGITDNKLVRITDKAKLPTDTVYTDDSQTLTTKIIDSITNTVKNISSFKYTIFKDGSTYYCRNNSTGVIDISNSSPNTVIQYPLTNGGSAYIQDGDYTLTGNPTDYFTFPTEPVRAQLHFGPNANIIVPNAFAGNVFVMRNSSSAMVSSNRLNGAIIKEAGSVARNWTGVLVEAIGTTTKGVYKNTVENCIILFPNIGIKLNNSSTSTNGFVNDNLFHNNTITGGKTAFVEFGMDTSYIASINGIHRNRFTSMLLQASNGTDTTIGFKNVRHKENSFINCYVADFSGSNVAGMTVHTDATDTEIIAGTIDIYNFTDSGTRTKRLTQTGLVIDKIVPSNGTNLDIIPTGSSSTLSVWNSGSTERLYMQTNSTQHLIDFVRQTSGGALKPAIFRQLDAVGGGAGTVESFRIMTTGQLRVNTNMLQILDSDSLQTYNILTSNLAASRNATLPLLLSDDQFTMDSHATTLSNKNISGSSNTITNIGDSAIASHTSTKITITSKGQLNSAIVYNDQANSINGTLTLSKTSGSSDFEAIFNTGVSDAPSCAFNLSNGTSTNTVYTPLLSASALAGATTAAHVGFQLRSILLTANDTGSIPLGIIEARHSDSTAITTRPIFGVRNLNTDEYLFYPTYLDLTSNELRNAVIHSSVTGIVDTNIASGAAIVTSKLADSANFFLKNTDNNIGAHYVDMTRITTPGNPTTNDGRFYNKQIDSNNDGFFVKIKKNGSFQEVQIA